MKITYQVRDICEYVGSTTANCQISIYGRWCDLTIVAYFLGENPLGERAVACSYRIRPLDNRELRCSSFDGVPDGMLPLTRGNGGNHQSFDQAITFPTIYGEFFDKRTIGDGVEEARGLMRGILRGVESMAETVRSSIRCSFPKNIRDVALHRLNERYGPVTENTLRTLLGEIHWRLMLSKSGCDEQQLGCIEYMAAHNFPRFHDANFEGESDIPLVGERRGDVVAGMTESIRVIQAERMREERRRAEADRLQTMLDEDREATRIARDLLLDICGKELAQQFAHYHYITIEQGGYKFLIPASGFISCTDPNGKRADLCIHSQGLQVNPIDEVILAYLYIRNNLSAYLGEAIIQGGDREFQKRPTAA